MYINYVVVYFMKNIKKALIIDSSYIIHRCLAVEQIYNFTDSKGRRTGAIYQYLRMLIAAMKKFPDYFPINCFDHGRSPRRLKLYPNYKHELDRTIEVEDAKTNPELMAELTKKLEYVDTYHNQRNAIVELLHQLGLPALMIESCEGDDLQYLATTMVDESIIMTDDKDLIQLLSPTVSIWRPMKEEVINYKTYQAEHNDPQMRKYVMIKAICGDTSDNIPSCAKGVGNKSAEFIVEQMITNPDNWQDVVANHKLKRIRGFLAPQFDKSGLPLPDSMTQFKTNMELVDLQKVVFDDYIKAAVINEINSVKVPNYFKVAALLADYDIQNIDVSELVRFITNAVTKIDL